MEPKSATKEKFFIVIRGKSRKGFCRGCIGRVEAETQSGELMGLLYSGGSNAGSPKSGGMVKTEDTYPLTRYQAQLLLFVSSSSKRLELLCNPQLFTAICELSQDDLVVVKHKRAHLPGLVKNLMQIGKKENKEDLQMLGFEVEFMVGKHKYTQIQAELFKTNCQYDLSISNFLEHLCNYAGVCVCFSLKSCFFISCFLVGQ